MRISACFLNIRLFLFRCQVGTLYSTRGVMPHDPPCHPGTQLVQKILDSSVWRLEIKYGASNW